MKTLGNLGLLLAAMAFTAALGGNAWAQEAGLVKSSRGKVMIERDGQSLAALPGVKVMASDRLVSGPDASAGIALLDNTLLTVGPNSTVTLDRFAFDSTTHQGALEASIKRGTLAVVSGKIAKASPEAVQFRTPHSILGVRGTEFIIEAGIEP
jgi:hypothetical protein